MRKDINMTETTNPVVIQPEDEKLAEQAYQEIVKIFSKNAENAMTESGQYLIDTFYEGKIKLARDKKSPKEESLNQLIKILQGSSVNSPSKSWMYNSIGLVIQNEEIKNVGDDVFHTYGNLLLSHKIVILTAKEMGHKITMIKESADKTLTVRELKDLKKKLIPPKAKSVTLLTLLDYPDTLFNDEKSDMKDMLSLENINNLSDKKRKAIREKAIAKGDELEFKIDELAAKIKEQEKYIKKFKKLSEDLGKNIENEST